MGRGVAPVGLHGQAEPRGGVQPRPRGRRRETETDHVLNEPVHAQDRTLPVDERQAQQLPDRLLDVQLVAVGQGPQHLDGDGIGREERHRLQHSRGERGAATKPVEGEAPGGGDRAQLGLAAAVEAHVVGHGHARLLDVGAGLLQSERKVAEQVGQLCRGRGVLVAAALDDVGDRLRAGQRRHRDRPGQPSPGLVPRGDDDVAVHRGGQVGLQPGGLVGVVEHQHPARGAVQLGPQRGAGVLLTRPRARCPAPSRDRPGPAAVPAGSSAPTHHATRPARCRRCASSHASSVLPAPGMPYSTTGRWPPSSSAASTTAASSGRSTNARARCGRFDRSAGPAALTDAQRLLGQHRGVDAAQRRGRVHAELVGQRPAAALVRGERVGLASRRVERHHLPGGQRLAQGVARHQLAEPVDVLAAAVQPQVRVGERLGGGHPQLVEPVGLGVDDRDVRDVGDARVRALPLPPRQRRLQEDGGVGVGAAGEGAAAVVHLGDERVGVHRDQLPVDDVAAAALRDRVAAQHLAQPRHERVHGVRARPAAPHVLDEPLGRDRHAARDEDPGQHRALGRPAEPYAAHRRTTASSVPSTQQRDRRVGASRHPRPLQ